MSLIQIKVGGFGGQGVILTGTILGQAAALFDNKNATMTRSYGPEARGGACSAQIVLSSDVVNYPYVMNPDILIVMSQEACDRYLPEMNDGGLLLYESDLVKPNPKGKKVKLCGIPTTRLAEELGNRVVQNIVMLGYFSQVSNATSKEALQEAIKSSVPSKTIELNLSAFDQGFMFKG
jgi:2-oxoglutarate ferredoxin oxidoreductase subunit gamma